MIAIPEGTVRMAVTLAIGLLLGAERERRMAHGPRGIGGVRTFALVSLAGGVADRVGGVPLVTAGFAVLGLATVAGYLRSDEDDRGLTSESALLVAYLLGVLAQRDPVLASATAVGVTILLATRTTLHRFVAEVLTDAEVHDALLLGAAGTVILPLLPNQTVDPLHSLNPFGVWRLVVLLMCVSACGYIAMRVLGQRVGLPLAGLVGGFVSSTATVAASAAQAKRDASLARPAVAAAMLSNVATMIQLSAVLGTASASTLIAMRWPLLVGGLLAGLVGLVVSFRARNAGNVEAQRGHAFDLRMALLLAAVITVVSMFAATLERSFGETGVVVAALLGGFPDVHATSIGVASLVSSGQIQARDAVMPLLCALTSNSLSKVMVSLAGGPRFALVVAPGLLLTVGGAWVTALVVR